MPPNSSTFWQRIWPGARSFDERGFVLYAFTADKPGRSNCYGACAVAWPPYIVSARPKAGRGVTGRLGTTRRRDGRLQGTLNGRPLYYYVGDDCGDSGEKDEDSHGGSVGSPPDSLRGRSPTPATV